ncbi:hypothetical protein BTVI_04328 [Pitangus sulphuratus]|nr:hypothetical protein BTVI_04328 [Pitangus sulphuratus]
MEAEKLMVLFGDDSVEVHYAGGSRLLLSPCGCEYLYEAALPAAAHPLQPAETTRQRVAFVVSAYREQLLRALDFRNKFSSRPYLPSRVIPPERKKILLSDILEIRWPDPATADLTRCIDNGSVKISSVDGYAHLYLSELQQEFTVEFLCKVSQSSAASLRSSQKYSYYRTGVQHEKPSNDSVTEMSLKQTKIENKKNKHSCAEGKFREPTKPKDRGDRDGDPLFYTSFSSEYTFATQLQSPTFTQVPETDGREMLPALLYEKIIPSMGRLLVYSDHKVHAAFWDGLTLNVVWDFSSSSNEIQVNEDIGWCKLTTPDGVQQLIQISHPGVYERSADAELEKIQRFNSDRLLQFSFIQQNDWLRAFSDNAVHGILGMWSWAIVIGLRKKSDFTEVTLAGFLASVIDVDHFFLAGSLSLKCAAWQARSNCNV